jgi:hypothetical protein
MPTFVSPEMRVLGYNPNPRVSTCQVQPFSCSPPNPSPPYSTICQIQVIVKGTEKKFITWHRHTVNQDTSRNFRFKLKKN